MKKFRVGAYLRISKRENEEHSIANQRKIINDYIKEHSDLEIYSYYEDNGYSGTNFDRPELKRMIKDITDGIIDVAIVKDLSRLGRNYIMVGGLLNGIFPLYDTKLISIGDNIDTINNDDDNYFYTAVLNILNHSYSQDISSKVKSTFRIKKIFNSFISGKSCMQIAKELNSEKVLPPRLYKIKNDIASHNVDGSPSYWSSKMISDILRNKTYIGYLVQGKQTRINYKIYSVPKENWIIVPNHHKAIIKEEIFDRVQEILDNTSNRINKNNEYDVLSGYVRCADCNEIMITKKR